MRKEVKKVFLLIIGIIFVLLGLLGLVLPFLQGIIFLIIGVIFISFYFPQVRLRMREHAKKAPHLFPIIDKIEEWIVKLIGDI